MQTTSHDISRRSFLAATGILGASTALGLAGCANDAKASDGSSASSDSSPYPQYDLPGRLSMSDFEASAAQPEPINEFDSEESYDVVIIGAGTGGVPAAIAAHEAGANVCLLQKESVAVAQGTGCSCINYDQSNELGAMHLMHSLREFCSFRANWELDKVWALNCFEALNWYVAKTEEAGLVKDVDFKSKDLGNFEYPEGNVITTMYDFTGGMNTPTVKLAEHFGDDVNIHYECPGIQLIKEGDRVTGVYARQKDGSILKITATKGVIIATGDYQNNDGMLEKYLPNALPFEKKQSNKTGDGHLMGMMAGAAMQTIGHTKMIHAKNWGANCTLLKNSPFLAVNMNGERFTAEDVGFYYRNNLVQYQPDGVWITIIDSEFGAQCEAMGEKPPTLEELEAVGEEGGVYKADTLEELANAINVPADALVATVERYNELCDNGGDLDFGKPTKYMLPLTTPPYYALHKEFAVSAITSGLTTNDKAQVLDGERKPIEGLFAVGNCSGPFYGSIDYPLDIAGLSVSRCITYGFVTGKYVANL